MKKSDICVVVPVYKEQLTELEYISLRQVEDILGSYEMIFAMPESLSFARDCKHKREYFDKKYFVSIESYNKLLLNEVFYTRFKDFKYMLLYQLDAFVFEDRLLHFSNLGYDYIGAPWLYGLEYHDAVWHVGNGGLSLRNIVGCMVLLEKSYDYLEIYNGNEDLFFSMGVIAGFKVAPVEIALDFSFETEVEKCFELNRRKLPFGCHAWARYNLAFWKPYIETYGHTVAESYLHLGNEDMERMKESQK